MNIHTLSPFSRFYMQNPMLASTQQFVFNLLTSFSKGLYSWRLHLEFTGSTHSFLPTQGEKYSIPLEESWNFWNIFSNYTSNDLKRSDLNHICRKKWNKFIISSNPLQSQKESVGKYFRLCIQDQQLKTIPQDSLFGYNVIFTWVEANVFPLNIFCFL